MIDMQEISNLNYSFHKQLTQSLNKLIKYFVTFQKIVFAYSIAYVLKALSWKHGGKIDFALWGNDKQLYESTTVYHQMLLD